MNFSWAGTRILITRFILYSLPFYLVSRLPTYSIGFCASKMKVQAVHLIHVLDFAIESGSQIINWIYAWLGRICMMKVFNTIPLSQEAFNNYVTWFVDIWDPSPSPSFM